MINEKSDNLRVEGHIGTWYVISSINYHGKTYYLLESEQYGEDAPHIAIRQDGSLFLDDIHNGTDDIYEYLQENSFDGMI